MRSLPASVKRTAGKAMAMRLTMSVIAELSARSPFMNLSRAGVEKNRSRTSTVVPRLAAAGLTGETPPALDADFGGAVGAVGARADRQLRHRADRRQRLAAEAERADVVDVGAELRGAVARDRQLELAGRDAGAVVAHPDQRQPAA